MITLRQHQEVAVEDLEELKRKKFKTILCVQPTGSGKTIIKAYIARGEYESGGMTLIFAHRDVLLEQISGSLCLMGLPHGFICSTKTRRNITNSNLEKYGDSFFDETSSVILVSVQTFAARLKKDLYSDVFLQSVSLWLIDEAHHVIKDSN